jgi:hypothetical protein
MFRFAATWTLQLFGTLLLLAGMYWWLSWPDEYAWQVAASAVMALLLLAGTVCLERTVFAAHQDSAGKVLPRPSFTGCAAFGLWLAIFALLEFVLLSMSGGVERVSVRFAQVLHLPPRLTTSALTWCVLVTIWVLLPSLMLPVGTLLASRGFAALRWSAIGGALRVLRTLRYWGGFALALACVYASSRLTGWIPERSTLRAELWSAGLRLGAAYVLVVTAIVLIAWSAGQVMADEGDAEAQEKQASVSS